MVSLVSLLLPDDRDFLFHPVTQTNLTLFTYIVDHQTSRVLVRNASNQTLRIPYRHKLGHLINIAYDNCFLTNTHSTFDTTTSSPLLQQLLSRHTSPPFLPSDFFLKTVLENGVRMYGDAAVVRQIAELVIEYSTIWESQGFIQIPLKRWMTVLLKPGWKSKVSAIKPQIYPLANKAWYVVDDTFDKMHKQGRL